MHNLKLLHLDQNWIVAKYSIRLVTPDQIYLMFCSRVYIKELLQRTCDNILRVHKFRKVVTSVVVNLVATASFHKHASKDFMITTQNKPKKLSHR